MDEKEIINISIKLFWNDQDEPDTIFLNGISYKKITDELVHSDIHDLISPINFPWKRYRQITLNMQRKTSTRFNLIIIKENEVELTLDDSEEPSDVFSDQSIDSLDNQHTYNGMANALSNQYPIILILSVNVATTDIPTIVQQSEDNRDSINFKVMKNNQQSPSQIDDTKDEIIDDDSESSEIQEDDDDYQKASLNISRKKKEKTQIQHTSSSETDSDSITNEIEKNKAYLLKSNFEIIQKNQLIVYDDKLFSKNSSIEDLLIMNFSHLFNDINVINFSLQSLPSYSTNMESLDTYFKEWAVQYNQLKSTKEEIEEKMLKLLYELRGTYLILLIMLAEEISERHEQRYWVGTWRLIELLNITHCPSSILVESGLTARFLMRDTNYDQFLKKPPK
ncbi:hypothetical protein F8M41_013527 [Gigaspora margarita]|uniref:Uncharacterized protein n=1 Tax=Gigaspora margarita TaxID=4874 RepID=A0A8H4AS74_GIGMA|nr:hypothetical protein F8M41_013527 [Gigaspora margarita]